MNIFSYMRKKLVSQSVTDIAKEQLEKNRAAIESLRDYDEGKKDISTTDVERRLRDIQAAA